MQRRRAAERGLALWNKMERASGELFALTYGAVVTQLLADYEDARATEEQLEKMGYNIGTRLIDEFLAKAQMAACASFPDAAEAIAKVGFRMFLGVSVEVADASATAFTLQLAENPLADFVQLPERYARLQYSNLLCGVLRGAMEMVRYRVACSLTRDMLWGDELTEIRVELKEVVEEEYHDDE